jgi:hypothetical protein
MIPHASRCAAARANRQSQGFNKGLQPLAVPLDRHGHKGLKPLVDSPPATDPLPARADRADSIRKKNLFMKKSIQLPPDNRDKE